MLPKKGPLAHSGPGPERHGRDPPTVCQEPVDLFSLPISPKKRTLMLLLTARVNEGSL